MSRLGSLLDLEDGSRLTDVALYPEEYALSVASGRASHQAGAIYLHVLTPHSTTDPHSLAGVISSFLPTRLASIAGYRPDGTTWIATAQYARHDITQVTSRPVADAALRRALDLTGIRAGRFSGFALPLNLLGEAYEGTGYVTDWTIDELFLGLVVELTTGDLPEVLNAGNSAAGRRVSRREMFEGLLDDWSAHPV